MTTGMKMAWHQCRDSPTAASTKTEWPQRVTALTAG
jgi:hypothetical protein